MSSENLAERVDSDVSHPSIFDPDSEDSKRRIWDKDYFFTILTFAAGLWVKVLFRLPTVMMMHGGGGAIMLAFTLVILFLCIPLATLETFIGQYGGKSFVLIMTEMVPVARGVGYVIVIDNFLEMAIYGSHISQLLFYFYYSFKPSPPWENCNRFYNTMMCTANKFEEICIKNTDTNLTGYAEGKCTTASDACGMRGYGVKDPTHCYKDDAGNDVVYLPHLNRPFAQEEFYQYDVRADYFGSISVQSTLNPLSTRHITAAVMTWVLAILLTFGIQVPKSYVPYVALMVPLGLYVVFLLISLCVKGAGTGISQQFLFAPKSFLSIRCWVDAARLAFTCMSVGYGTFPFLAARNKTRHRSYIDVTGLGIFCIVFVTLIGLSFYGLAGHIAASNEISTISQLSHESQDLARVYFSLLLGEAPPSMLWLILYFLTISLLGMGSLAVHMTCVVGEASSLTNFKYRKPIIYAVVSTFVLSLAIFLSHGGCIYVVETIDDTLLGSKKIIFSLMFVIVTVFVYGRDNLMNHMERRLRVRPWPPRLLCRAVWWVACPLLLAVLILMGPIRRTGTANRGDTPRWIKVVCVMYEFYYWPIIVGAAAWAWRQPRQPRGVWRMERADDDPEVAAPESYELVPSAQNSEESWQTCG